VRFLIALIPTKESVYRDNLAGAIPRPPDAYFRAVESERAFTESFEKFLSKHQIEFVNTTESLRSSLLQNQRPYPESDDGHPNKTGYAAIAKAIEPLMNLSDR
jgi:hypothetical protein